jgi:hypothetical protein
MKVIPKLRGNNTENARDIAAGYGKIENANLGGTDIFRTNFPLFAIINAVFMTLPNWGVYIGRGGGR